MSYHKTKSVEKRSNTSLLVSLFMLLFFGISNNLDAQSGDSTNLEVRNQQIWIDFYPHYYVNEKLEYYGDLGYRTTVSENSWNRFYSRPSVKYHFNKKWEIQSGVGVFYIFDKQNINQFEVTPWQGVQWNWMRLKRLKIHHLVKLEERWSFLTTNWESDFEFRFRYKLSGKLILNEKWAIPAYGEMFVPLSGEIAELYRNKGRAGVGLSYKATKEWVFSFLFNWQGSKTGMDEELGVNDYVYQLKIKKVWHNVIKKPHKKTKQ